MALTNPLGIMRTFRVPGGLVSRVARVSQTFRPNALIFARAGSSYAEVPLSATPRADLVVLGCFEGLATYTSPATDNGSGGAVNLDGTEAKVILRPGIADGFDTGSGANQITQAHRDQPCFAFDDNTLYLTDLGGTLPFAGFVDDVDPRTGKVAVRMGEDQRVLYELFSAAGLVPGAAAATSDDTVRTVATSIPAGTFSNGTLTLNANGAFSTAQDGVVLALTNGIGDKFILPAGTIGTLVVSAANSGVYQVKSLGSVSTPAVFVRTARWSHGAIITPETKIRVSGEPTLFSNTVWTAGPASSGLLVGTGDPALYPDRVVQSVSLGGGAPTGTATISNVPIRSATKTFPGITRTLAATPSLTVEYATTTITPGGIGTASLVIIAAVAAGTINTADGSTLAVVVEN